MIVNLYFAASERLRSDRGAVAGEYAVILGLITVALIVTLGLFTDALIRAFEAAIGVLP